jgi:pimeloyl-ACP methyl ester carboxylesterase
MATDYSIVNGSSLFYVRHGHGEKIMLLFHGFGQDHSVFKTIVDHLAAEYTCYSFDLYFHGSSTWAHDEDPLGKKEWIQTMEIFLQDNNINNFSLLGYSLGGKFAMSTLEAFPERTKELILIAPDGIKISFWYTLATYPLLLRKIFKGMISSHNRFKIASKTFQSLGLLNKSALKFAESQMNTAEKRKRVYYSWVVFRQLKFEMKNIGSIINSNQIRLLIMVGKYDKVIRAESMNKLLQYVNQYELEILDVGHNHLLEIKTAELIRPPIK